MNLLSNIRQAPLISASRLLAERGFYGIVWVDRSLVVAGIHGELVQFVEIGAPLTASVLPFNGLEGDIVALRESNGVIEVPSVTIVSKHGRTPRLNLAALWSPSDDCFLVMVSRAVVSSDLEVELNRQIRARLMAEADVQMKSLELQRANHELACLNADLEQFASIISHDLKSPLREMRHLTDDAQNALNSGDLAGGHEQLSAMRAQSQRMTQMLSALLAYATVGQRSDAVESVDTRALLQAVIKHLHRPPGVTVAVTGDWPRLNTMQAPLDLVLRNLIDNAFNHHDRSEGTVTVNGSDQPDAFVIAVTDDGPGISPRDQKAIFQPFRTLSRADDTPDSGMGLTLVARALNAVGGSIEVSSNAPKIRGTTFTVHWPKLP